MPIITRQELEDASQDAKTLEDFVNGAVDLNGNGEITTRLGRTTSTLAKLVESTQSTLDPEGVNAALAMKANTDYVDSQIAGRSAIGHVHSLSSLTEGGDMTRLAVSGKAVTDWDDTQENGWYTSASAANSPETDVRHIGTVQSTEDGIVFQTVMTLTDPQRVYRRTFQNSSWSTWNRVYQTSSEIAALAASEDPTKVRSLPVTALSTQSFRSGSVIMQDGSVKMWGSGTSGQLGQGSAFEVDRATPMTPAFPPGYEGNIQKLVRTVRCSWAIMDNGDVWSWGQNTFGALGHGNTLNQDIPRRIVALDGVTIVDVFSGYHDDFLSGYAIYLADDGSAYGCGYNTQGQLGLGDAVQRTTPTLLAKSDWVSFSATNAFGHTAGIDSAGQLWVWGHNTSGQVGNATTTQQNSPVRINSFGALTVVKVVCASNSATASTGFGVTCAITSDGALWCWGENEGDSLGLGAGLENQIIPMRAESAGTGVLDVCLESISGGGNILVTKSDRVLITGNNSQGQLGTDNTTASSVFIEMPNSLRPGRSIVKAMLVGSLTSLSVAVLYDDGRVYVVGDNSSGQLGIGSNADQRTLTPMLLSLDKTGDKAIDICPVGYKTEMGIAVLTLNGNYWQTGYGFSGQLGNDFSTISIPIQVKF